MDIGSTELYVQLAFAGHMDISSLDYTSAGFRFISKISDSLIGLTHGVLTTDSFSLLFSLPLGSCFRLTIELAALSRFLASCLYGYI